MTTTVQPLLPLQPVRRDNDALEIVVSQRHIRTGVHGSPWRCPVALALRSAGHESVMVACGYLMIGARRYTLPESLAQWISDYDHCQPVHPERWVLRP